jgi:hypothetical protein
MEQAMTQLTSAGRINSSNADYYWLRGRLALLLESAANTSRSSSTSVSSSAIRLFTQTIEKRPTWGLAWAYLAHAYAKDPTQHSRFITALQRAAELEPYENLNQRKIIPLALAHWEELPASLQQRLNAIITHGLNYNKNGIFIRKAAAHWNKAQVLVPLIKTKPQINELKNIIRQKAVRL